MKSFLWVILFFYNNTLTPITYDTNHSHTYVCHLGLGSTTIKNIFFTNETEDLVFIDFSAIDSKIYEVKILTNNQEVLVEDVKELPQDLIYEVDLTLLEKGDYEIHVHLHDEKIIKEKITVQ